MLNSCILTQFLVVLSVLSGVIAQADNSTTDCDSPEANNCENLFPFLTTLLEGNDEATTVKKCKEFQACSDDIFSCLKLDATKIRTECEQKLAATPVGTPPTDVTPGPRSTTSPGSSSTISTTPVATTPTTAPTDSSTTSDPVPTPPSTSAPTGSPSPSDPPTPPSTSAPTGSPSPSDPTAQPTVPTVPTPGPTIPTVPTAQPTVPTVPTAQPSVPTIPTVPTAQPPVPTVPTTTPTPPKPVSSACLKALSAINKAQYVQMIFDSVEDPRPSNSMRCSGIQMADNSAQDDVRAYCGPEDLTKLNEYVAAARARFGCAPPVQW